MPVPMQRKKKQAGIATVNCTRRTALPLANLPHVQFVNTAERMYSEKWMSFMGQPLVDPHLT